MPDTPAPTPQPHVADGPGSAAPPVLWCAPCISEARTAELLRQDLPEIHPAVTIMQGTAICDVTGRHRIVVQTPGSTLIVPQNGMPGLN